MADARKSDLREAVRLGLTWAWREAPPQRENRDLNPLIGQALHDPLNQLLTDHARALFGELGSQFTETQMVALRPVIAQLGRAASAGGLWGCSSRSGFEKAAGPSLAFLTQNEIADAMLPKFVSDDATDGILAAAAADEIRERAAAEGRDLSWRERRRIRAFASESQAASERSRQSRSDASSQLGRAARARVQAAATPADEAAYRASYPPPPIQPFGVSDYGAEEWCAQWIRHLGGPDAVVTKRSGDGGLDVYSELRRWGVQVKNYAGAVGEPAVRDLVGACAPQRLIPVFMTSGRYTASAINFARRANVTLYRYDVRAGTLDLI